MEQNQPVPPLTWKQDTYTLTCTGYPSISTSADGTALGTFAIKISAGTFACPGYSLAFVNSNIDVIAATGMGAQITPLVTYPPGFLTGATNPAINVTSNSICNLVPNLPDGDAGIATNTSCLNTLSSRYESGGSCSNQSTDINYLYFPTGVYQVNDAWHLCGNGWTFWGDGPQRSIIRLTPNSPTFSTGNVNSVPIFFNSPSVSLNASFREFINNLGITVGYGNPWIDTMIVEMNNVGGLRNVILSCEDSNCYRGLAQRRNFPGPALAKNLSVYGFRRGISNNQTSYSWTYDQITTEGQLDAAWDGVNQGSNLAIEHWLSDNTVNAFNEPIRGASSILNSALLNGDAGTTAITVASGASLFVRNVRVTGYLHSEVDSGTGTPVTYDGNLTENWTGTASCLFCSTPHSIGLPQAETPEPVDDPNPANWTQLDNSGANWATQIAGSASATVYAAPSAHYSGTGNYNVTVPDTVNHLQFYNSLDPSKVPTFTFTVAGSSSTPLVIDGCIYQACFVNHTGPRTVVIRDTTFQSVTGYTATSGAGNLFLEDVFLPSLVGLAGKNIWARQLDIEHTASSGSLLSCQGCNLWVLGYKTEVFPDAWTLLSLSSGAKAEVFTAFAYPLQTSTQPTAIFNLSNSTAWIAPTFEFVTVNGRGFPYWVSETQGGLSTLATPGQDSNDYILNGFYSYGVLPAPSISGGVAIGPGMTIQ